MSQIELPNILFATHLEKIAKDPYSFFVEKILKLEQIPDFNEYPGYADFGIIVHKCLEVYFKLLESKNDDKNSWIKVLDNFPQYIKNMYLFQIENIINSVKKFHKIEEFIAQKAYIDSNCNFEKILHFEHTMSIVLHFKNLTFDLRAIIDRLEQFQILHNVNFESNAVMKNTDIEKPKKELKNKILVIDYKTGVCPTQSQIKNFKTIQLSISCFLIIINTVSELIQQKNLYSIENWQIYQENSNTHLKFENFDKKTSAIREIWEIFDEKYDIELQYLKLSAQHRVNKVNLKFDEEFFINFFEFLINLLEKYSKMTVQDFLNAKNERYKNLLN